MPTNSLPVAVESISPEHLDPPSPRLSTMSSRRSSLSTPPPDNSLPINVSIPNRIDQTCATVKPSIRPLERQPPLTNMKNKLHPGESRESRLHWDVVMAVDISMLPPTSLSAGLEKPEQVIQPPDVTGTSVASANDEELVENPVKEEVQVLQLTRTETSPLSDCPAASVEKESFSSLPEDKKLSIADDSVSVVAQSLTITDPVVSFAATQKHIQRKSSSISISDNAVDPAMSIPSTLTPSVSHNQAVFKNSAISVSVESKAKSKARSKSKREKEPIDEREAGPSEPPRKKRRRSNGVESKDSKTMNSSRHRDHGVDTQRNADSRCSGDSDCKARSDCTPGTSNIRAKGKAKSRSRSRPPEENLADALARICDDRTPSSPPPQPTGPKKKSKSSPPIGASSPKHEETQDEIAQQKLCSELTGMLIESLATSRASSLTPTVLYKTITQSHPHLKTEERTKKAWIQLISDVLELGGMFEKVESSGEDGEARWFYVPERDEDQERAGLISALMPRQKRNETKKYKQYYYQPLDRISRWDPEDAP
ncbi:hypothetical protein BJ138DRAFT_292045 [Hygrophoropsis aurantiaca]|uniref:Uncharacterized protein n=1 Tax=Hygrophoropsis aurantiaca TaxID=72124 RepID=A0ACB8ATP5_9AGAM|nr:hypothetical protein BJ138DRAFT_292045 [Hygrophoropsis aurantiaca]